MPIRDARFRWHGRWNYRLPLIAGPLERASGVLRAVFHATHKTCPQRGAPSSTIPLTCQRHTCVHAAEGVLGSTGLRAGGREEVVPDSYNCMPVSVLLVFFLHHTCALFLPHVCTRQGRARMYAKHTEDLVAFLRHMRTPALPLVCITRLPPPCTLLSRALSSAHPFIWVLPSPDLHACLPVELCSAVSLPSLPPADTTAHLCCHVLCHRLLYVCDVLGLLHARRQQGSGCHGKMSNDNVKRPESVGKCGVWAETQVRAR